MTKDDDDIQDYVRPWVGLTEEEMKKTWYEMQNIMGWYSFQEIAQAIEAKLRSATHDLQRRTDYLHVG